MFNRTRASSLFALMLTALVIAGCGGSSIESGTNDLLTCNAPNVPDASGTSCVPPPPIQCTPPTVPNATNDACVVGADPTLPDPIVFPSEDQAVLYYNRAGVGADNSPNDPSYEGWRLHTWSNDACDAYADGDTDWANGRIHNGVDPNYGAYWILDLKPGYAGTAGSCHNFIIHIGTEDSGKEMGGADFKGKLDQDDPKFARMNFTLSGEPTVFEFPLLSLGPQPVKIEGFSAHWLDASTLLWDAPDGVESVKLHYSADGDLEATLENGLNGTAVDLMSTSLSDAQIARAPHLANLTAFEGSWSENDAKAVAKAQAVLGGYDADGTLVAATGIQMPLMLDALYTLGDDDANEADLGGVYTDNGITAAVWAPTAQNVRLLTYNSNKTQAAAYTMTEDPATGIWSYNGDMSLDRTLYRYEVTVFHPVTGNVETLLVTDPYSVSTSTNGRFSRFVNLADEDLKPAGWDSHSIPTVANWEDAIIYEGHIRDFSARDESTSEANRGKYLAFTEQGTAPVMHLEKLVEAGMTHFHMLPTNDIATIDEDPTQTVDLFDTVGDLCRLNGDAAVCAEEDAGSRLIDVLESYDPLSEAGKAQQLAQDMRGFDEFNWGYDPHHFNTPEGSYASSAEGVERIIEKRQMITALHEMGLRVVMDVVYNHTNASGVFTKSVLDKVVPGYYHRYEVGTGAITRETCCDDTEPRNAMFEKFMKDSLLVWTEHYKIDSFRFDIMSHASKDTMLRLRDAVQAVDPDNYFYGEGWPRVDRGFEVANQLNMAGTQIGTFNDRIREAIRQGQIFDPENEAALSQQDRVKVGLIGNLTDYILETSAGVATTTASLGGYAKDPADIINYVSKHDNETLWDQFNYVLPSDISLEQRVRAQNIGITLPLMSQGIPFLQMGGDMLRSKSMDRNTYDAGDWFNYVDFTMLTNNWNVGLPLAEDNQGRWAEMGTFINAPERAATMTEIEFASAVFNEFLSIRSDSPLFRLTEAQDIIDRIGFHNIGRRQQVGLIAMSIDDGITPDSDLMLMDIDPNYDALMVIANTGYEEKSITVNMATGFELHMTQMNSYDATVRGAMFTEGEDGNGTFTVPAMTMAVFVKPQMGAQGFGLPSFATAGAPDVVPFGDTTVYLRGGMNGWGTDNAMDYAGDGIYEVEVTLNADEEVFFKVASEDWAAVNLGAVSASDTVVELGVDKAMATTNDNFSITAPATTLYRFSVDASDVAEPVLNVNYGDTYFDNPVYLRGGMNGWGTDNPFEYQGGRKYAEAIAIDAGSYEFKVATDDWATVNMGALDAEDRAVEIGVEKIIGTSNDNLTIDIADSDSYVFVFDLSDADEPLISVFKEEFFGDTEVFLRGGMNGWGTDNLFTFQEGAYVTDIDVSQGSVEFKVASDDWSTVNLGTPDGDDTTVTLGVPKVLAPSNNNLLLDFPASATYEFKVEGPSANSPTITVTEK
ncbi:pullulanase-type alpha-1,6-glucosidase [Alteromonas sediminis]|uniref:Pullulanase-type alpha-1,6-glucosidase n=1 Tax=Alteromonas sediminis TaxID=2259342 RepID=A0A3N5ZCG3_9ALTE|nr:pullulanase-type alpha-1,6-glucosidase [Alteromonas sediminis]RPJ67578.1 pullulanase-type alpha-1,6-glucosidase [Alteromonas sediminis]